MAEDQERELGGRPANCFNASRHEHVLVMSINLPPYTCSGCKEAGANIGYICSQRSSSSSCENFILHQACATLNDEARHPSRSDLNFKFRDETKLWHRCTACCHTLKGYVFETEQHNVRLHPLCLALPEKLDFDGHANHMLTLVASKGSAYSCNSCDRRIDYGSWKYRCEEVACRVYLDLSCAKNHFHGFSDPGNERAQIRRRRDRVKSVAKLIGSILTVATGISTIMELFPADKQVPEDK